MMTVLMVVLMTGLLAVNYIALGIVIVIVVVSVEG